MLNKGQKSPARTGDESDSPAMTVVAAVTGEEWRWSHGPMDPPSQSLFFEVWPGYLLEAPFYK